MYYIYIYIYVCVSSLFAYLLLRLPYVVRIYIYIYTYMQTHTYTYTSRICSYVLHALTFNCYLLCFGLLFIIIILMFQYSCNRLRRSQSAEARGATACAGVHVQRAFLCLAWGLRFRVCLGFKRISSPKIAIIAPDVCFNAETKIRGHFCQLSCSVYIEAAVKTRKPLCKLSWLPISTPK